MRGFRCCLSNDVRYVQYVSGKSCGWASIFKGAYNRKGTYTGIDSLFYIPVAMTAEAGPWILRSMSLIIHGCFANKNAVLRRRTPCFDRAWHFKEYMYCVGVRAGSTAESETHVRRRIPLVGTVCTGWQSDNFRPESRRVCKPSR
jgi:hypothetical protein